MSRSDALRAELELVEAEEAFVALKADLGWPEKRKPGEPRPAELEAAAAELRALRAAFRSEHRAPANDGAQPETVTAEAKAK